MKMLIKLGMLSGLLLGLLLNGQAFAAHSCTATPSNTGGTSFQVDVSVTNTGTTALSSWSVTLAWPEQVCWTSDWNIILNSPTCGTSLQFTNEFSWQLPAPGQTATNAFGFQLFELLQQQFKLIVIVIEQLFEFFKLVFIQFQQQLKLIIEQLFIFEQQLKLLVEHQWRHFTGSPAGKPLEPEHVLTVSGGERCGGLGRSGDRVAEQRQQPESGHGLGHGHRPGCDQLHAVGDGECAVPDAGEPRGRG
jgi:hypothetical protein